jgi:hypothetical protein
MNSANAALTLTVLVLLALLLFPTGDGSYACHRPPVTLLVVPATERPLVRQDFFDEGYQCNRDAWRRGVEGLAVLVTGSLLTITLQRRSRRPRV